MSDDLGKAIRNKAIDDCVAKAIEWRDSFKDSTSNVNNELCYVLLNNFVAALANLKLN